MDIYKNGFTFHIERYGPVETDKQLIERSWFIVNLLLNNKQINQNQGALPANDNITELLANEFNDAVQKSKIWHNMKVLKCKYKNSITNEIKDIYSNHFV